ncbi:MAG: hypothetical protein AB7V32_10085, partial [Candidatus Berkiella sp.]
MLNPQLTQDPANFNFVQSTVSTKFSQGAPNPKKPTETLPPQHLKAVASQLEKHPEDAKKFPALHVFTVDDPDTQETLTFSLDTRRLLTFKMGKVHQARVERATVRDLRTSTWKMTHENGGYTPPTMTDMNARKDAMPETYTTLYKLRREIEQASQAEDALCAQQHVAD